jgi:hypothetical protein
MSTPREELAELLNGSGLRLAPDVLNSRLQAIWPELRGGQLHGYDQAALIALFQRAGYVSDGPTYPDADLTVYRGEPATATGRGISWSLSLEVATTYARGNAIDGTTYVWRASAPPAGVLAQFVQDAEVVLEPDQLTAPEVVGHFPRLTL